jgi:NAD-dependent DNA ligase
MNNILSFFTGSTKPSGVSARLPFSGKIVAFTGTLQSGSRKMQRSEAQRIVQSLGGNVIVGEYGRIRNANLLVLGTQAGNRTQSQKMDAARDRGVATITAEQFFAMIG